MKSVLLFIMPPPRLYMWIYLMIKRMYIFICINGLVLITRQQGATADDNLIISLDILVTPLQPHKKSMEFFKGTRILIPNELLNSTETSEWCFNLIPIDSLYVALFDILNRIPHIRKDISSQIYLSQFIYLSWEHYFRGKVHWAMLVQNYNT